MHINFEKIGKFTVSCIFTGIFVTGIVVASTTWDNLVDGDILTGSNWQNLVANISGKLNKSEIPVCTTGESLTYDGTTFSCFAPAQTASIEMPQAGMAYNNTFDNKTVNINFTTAFSSTPQIVVAMNGFYLENSSRGEKFELYPTYSNVSSTGFRLTIPGNTRNNHKLKAASVMWMALPASGTWSSPSISNITASCQASKRTTNNEKTGSCVKGSFSNTYYGGESTCSGFFGPPDWEGFPTMMSGYKYSKKYTQTCQ